MVPFWTARFTFLTIFDTLSYQSSCHHFLLNHISFWLYSKLNSVSPVDDVFLLFYQVLPLLLSLEPPPPISPLTLGPLGVLALVSLVYLVFLDLRVFPIFSFQTYPCLFLLSLFRFVGCVGHVF